MKEHYIDIMERVVSAYTLEHIRRYTKQAEENGIEEHGFPRLTANIGILIANGRRPDLKQDFIRMMDICCEGLCFAKKKNGRRAGNDFSVKEICLCLLALEKGSTFDNSYFKRWRGGLKKIVPHDAYTQVAAVPPRKIPNWAAFAAASEQARKYALIASEDFFINNQIKSQLLSFDENGMYEDDPGNPMVYDFTTRLQLALALYLGFDGECQKELYDTLMRSAKPTLLMQSVTGEIPYGGRSAQFIFNEAMFASLCEFYATAFKKAGRLYTAGMFKSAARSATAAVDEWIAAGDIHHIKNFFPVDTKYGCEEYAYFNKYMVTAASMIYPAFLFADDTISEVPCPSQTKSYIFETGSSFNKFFANYKGVYFIELDTKPDINYDAGAIGRIHKAGAPSAICLSLPFCENPKYTLDIKNKTPLSLSAGVNSLACESGTEYNLVSKYITGSSVSFIHDIKLKDKSTVRQRVTISDSGVLIELLSQSNTVLFTLPVFMFDGKDYTCICRDSSSVTVKYKGHICRYETDGSLDETDDIYANRNGHYKKYLLSKEDKLKINIKID